MFAANSRASSAKLRSTHICKVRSKSSGHLSWLLIKSFGCGVGTAILLFTLAAQIFAHTALSLELVKPATCASVAVGAVLSGLVLANGIAQKRLLCGVSVGVFYALCLSLTTALSGKPLVFDHVNLALLAALLFGGTGTQSIQQEMPEELPERLEAGTLNVPGYAALTQGLKYLKRVGTNAIFRQEQQLLQHCVRGLVQQGFRVFAGAHQAATVSFLPGQDCEEAAEVLARQGIAVRAGLHCAPLAHERAGTLETGTVRVSLGFDTTKAQIDAFLRAAAKLSPIRS